MMNISFRRQNSIENKLIKLRKEYSTQRREVRKLREKFAHTRDKNELFNDMSEPLVKENDRMAVMNNKLVDANLMGYEAEMYGNNIQNELMRNDEQFSVIQQNVRNFFLFYRNLIFPFEINFFLEF